MSFADCTGNFNRLVPLRSPPSSSSKKDSVNDDTYVTAIQSNESDKYEVLKSMSDTVKTIHTSLQQLES
jgi:hypothetical protein